MNPENNLSQSEITPSASKRKLPFWIKKKYLPTIKTVDKKTEEVSPKKENKGKTKRSLLRNSPFRDIDKGLMS
jgi:hypothetical protein